jgi:hypothetical protein
MAPVASVAGVEAVPVPAAMTKAAASTRAVATGTAAVGSTSTLGESRGREQNHPQHSNLYSAHYQYLSSGVILLKRHMQVLHVWCQVVSTSNP